MSKRRIMHSIKKQCKYKTEKGWVWKSREEANQAIERMNMETGEMWAKYECLHCGLFHLITMEQKVKWEEGTMMGENLTYREYVQGK